MKKISKTCRIGLFGILLGFSMTAPARAADAYPQQPLHIVDAYPPGGSTDVLARIVGQELAASLGQPVVVENRPGAAGNIGTSYVARAKKDGYTLGIAPNQTVAVNPVLYSKLSFDAGRDLTGVSLLARLPMVLVVKSESKIGSIEGLITAATNEPEKITFASAGAGSPQHMSAAVFQALTRTHLTHVPYKGTTPALTDVLSGTVDFMFCPLNSALPYIQNGRLKALGVTSVNRIDSLPNVPAIIEKVPTFESDIWVGMVVPTGTPAAIVTKLNGEIRRILAFPSVKQSLKHQGITAEASTVEEFNALIKNERERWAKIIVESNITIDSNR